MPSLLTILEILKKDYPSIIFTEDDEFSWSPNKNTIRYYTDNNEWEKLFHELGHAINNHQKYTHDIGLLSNEREAWSEAIKIAKNYNLNIEQTTIESQLDTYRTWLSSRSTCPSCHSIGIQIAMYLYSCIICGQSWKVNEAKICSLRRYKIINKRS